MTGVISGLEKAAVPAGLLTDSLADQLLNEARIHDAAALLARSGVTVGLMEKLAECMLAAELKHHLLDQTGQGAARFGNYRNGSTPKKVFTPSGELELAVPRIRFSTFVPRLIPRYQRQLPGFDDDILFLYGRGLSAHELQSRLLGLYGERAWAELCDTLTNEVLLHTGNWQARRLERSCALLYFGALQTQRSPKAPLFFALGMREDGRRDVFGFWITSAADVAFWCDVMNELKGRGLGEPGTIAGSRLHGLLEAAEQVYPAARFKLMR